MKELYPWPLNKCCINVVDLEFYWEHWCVILNAPLQKIERGGGGVLAYFCFKAASSLNTALSADRTVCRVCRASVHAGRPKPMKALSVD